MSYIRLRKIDPEDTDNILKWRNSPFVSQNLFTREKLTRAQHMNWLKTNIDAGKCFQFIIEIISSDIPIGTVFIKNIDSHSQKAELGIFIGEANCIGKGYGTEAVNLILDFAFNDLNLNKIYLYVFENNIAGIKSYLSAGFKLEGTLREYHKMNEDYLNVLHMGILKRERGLK
jgi:UDP-4-amino-4,6-dideoxy-N-acetyl-beta-L-altrosamine N-acetyltransferase